MIIEPLVVKQLISEQLIFLLDNIQLSLNTCQLERILKFNFNFLPVYFSWKTYGIYSVWYSTA